MIVLSAGPVPARQKAEHATAVFPILQRNGISVRYQKAFTEWFAKIPNAGILDESKYRKYTGKPRRAIQCNAIRCAVKLGKELGATRAIIGWISMQRRTYLEPLAPTGPLSFILKKVQTEYYRFQITLIDVLKGEEIAVYNSSEFQWKDHDKEMQLMVARLSREYKPLTWRIVGSYLMDFVNFHYSEYSVSLLGLNPYGALTELVKSGVGANFRAGFQNRPFFQWYFFLSASVMNFRSGNIEIDRFITMPLTVHMGYRLNIGSKWHVTPSVGFGYHIHYIRDFKGTTNISTAPLTVLEMSVSYDLAYNYGAFLLPQYGAFFEPGGGQSFLNVGSYLAVYGGMRRYFR